MGVRRGGSAQGPEETSEFLGSSDNGETMGREPRQGLDSFESQSPVPVSPKGRQNSPKVPGTSSCENFLRTGPSLDLQG